MSVRRQTRGRNTKTVVSATNKDFNLVGFDFGELSKEKDTNNFAIGVWNEKSKKLTLYSSEHIFALRTSVEENPEVANDNLAMKARSKILTEEFGSKKKKRAMVAAESNTILSENISGVAALETSLISSIGGVDNNLIQAAESALAKSLKVSNKRKR